MYIAIYKEASYHNHEPRRDRKLLLKKQELKKLEKKVKEKGLTIIPLKLYINKRGFAKIEIALAKGKKIYDKRESIKDRDIKRDLGRKFKFK
jgi:SsrA-binding protein